MWKGVKYKLSSKVSKIFLFLLSYINICVTRITYKPNQALFWKVYFLSSGKEVQIIQPSIPSLANICLRTTPGEKFLKYVTSNYIKLTCKERNIFHNNCTLLSGISADSLVLKCYRDSYVSLNIYMCHLKSLTEIVNIFKIKYLQNKGIDLIYHSTMNSMSLLSNYNYICKKIRVLI